MSFPARLSLFVLPLLFASCGRTDPRDALERPEPLRSRLMAAGRGWEWTQTPAGAVVRVDGSAGSVVYSLSPEGTWTALEGTEGLTIGAPFGDRVPLFPYSGGFIPGTWPAAVRVFDTATKQISTVALPSTRTPELASRNEGLRWVAAGPEGLAWETTVGCQVSADGKCVGDTTSTEWLSLRGAGGDIVRIAAQGARRQTRFLASGELVVVEHGERLRVRRIAKSGTELGKLELPANELPVPPLKEIDGGFVLMTSTDGERGGGFVSFRRVTVSGVELTAPLIGVEADRMLSEPLVDRTWPSKLLFAVIEDRTDGYRSAQTEDSAVVLKALDVNHGQLQGRWQAEGFLLASPKGFFSVLSRTDGRRVLQYRDYVQAEPEVLGDVCSLLGSENCESVGEAQRYAFSIEPVGRLGQTLYLEVERGRNPKFARSIVAVELPASVP